MAEIQFDESFLFMVSARAAKKLGVKTSELPAVGNLPEQVHWFATWRCELMASNPNSNTDFFLITNAKTLYSLVMSSRDGDPESLFSDFATVLYRFVATAGHAVPSDRAGSFELVKGQARSLIGCQNELIRCNIHRFHEESTSLEKITRGVNMTVMMPINGIPDDEFSSALSSSPPFPGGTEPPENVMSF